MTNEKQDRNRKLIKKILIKIILALIILFAAAIAVISTIKLDDSNKKTSSIISSGFSTIESSSKSSEKKSTNHTTKKTSEKATRTTTSKSASSKTTKYIKQVEYPIDINQAEYDDLIQINGVGDTIANKILSYRNSVGIISNMNMLLNIDGIGEATLENLQKYLYVSAKDYKDTESLTTTVTFISSSETTVTSASKANNTTSKTLNERKKVNINEADADEIASALLIDKSLADEIVNLRNKISYFSDFRELLYVNGMTEDLLFEIKDYIEI